MTFAALIPAMLSLLLLAAHFFRMFEISDSIMPLAAVGVSVGAMVLLFVRRAWAARVLQVILILGATEYVRTVFGLLDVYAMAGRPAGRMVLIIASVIGFMLAAALLFKTGPLRRHFRVEPAE